MRIVLGPLLNDARGKLGSMVFSVAKSGQHYVREKAAIMSNPRSADQQFIRNAMTWLYHEWRFTLTAAERAAWENFSHVTQRTAKDFDQGGGAYNLIPRSKPYTGGYQAYVGTNMRIFMCDGDYSGLISGPPTGDRPWMVEDLAIVWNVTDDDIDLTWTDPGYSDLSGTSYLRIWIESYEAGAHKQLLECIETSAELHTVVNVKYALGIEDDIGQHPGIYRLQCDVVMLLGGTSDGLVSPPSRLFQIDAVI